MVERKTELEPVYGIIIGVIILNIIIFLGSGEIFIASAFWRSVWATIGGLISHLAIYWVIGFPIVTPIKKFRS